MATSRSYWHLARAPRYSVLLALPLLALYEALALLLATPEGGVRNGADVLLKSVFVAALGPWGAPAFGAVLVGVAAWVVWRDLRGQGGVRRGIGALRGAVFAGMLAEAVVLALLFGGAVSLVTAGLLGSLAATAAEAAPTLAAAQTDVGLHALSWPERLMISLGAGLYEELLFRVVLVGALAAGARRLLGLAPGPAAALAVALGALVFSAFHYVGAFGDPLALDSFTFRFVAGLFFSGLFVLRGFGITAWTHALYDVFILAV